MNTQANHVAKPLDEDALAEAIADNIDANDPEALERAELMAAIAAWVLDGQDAPAGEPQEVAIPVETPAPRRRRKAKAVES